MSEENILWLYVSVNDKFFVNIVNSLTNLLDN